MKSQPKVFWKHHLPNLLTWLRIALVLPAVYFLMFDTREAGFIAGWCFIIASISDFFDGYFARLYQVESRIGIFLDPIADKLLVTSALIMLIPLGRISALLVVLLISRDIFINGLRAIAAGENVIIGAGWTGKWKTVAQLVGIPCLIMVYNIPEVPLLQIGQGLLWLSVFLSVTSGYQYLAVFFGPKKTPGK